MVSADVGGTIKVWDTMPWADRETLRVQGTSLSAVGLSPDGRVIATATDKNRIQLWSRRSP
jgi:WD40 repeat protein